MSENCDLDKELAGSEVTKAIQRQNERFTFLRN